MLCLNPVGAIDQIRPMSRYPQSSFHSVCQWTKALQTLTSSNITRGTPQAGLVQLYKDQNNIIHTLIIVYAKNNKFMGLLPNNPSGKWAFHLRVVYDGYNCSGNYG